MSNFYEIIRRYWLPLLKFQCKSIIILNYNNISRDGIKIKEISNFDEIIRRLSLSSNENKARVWIWAWHSCCATEQFLFIRILSGRMMKNQEFSPVVSTNQNIYEITLTFNAISSNRFAFTEKRVYLRRSIHFTPRKSWVSWIQWWRGNFIRKVVLSNRLSINRS